MPAYVRITRGDAPGLWLAGSKRLGQFGTVEAVADDGTVVDLSACVANTEILLKPGDVERVVITFLAFEVES